MFGPMVSREMLEPMVSGDVGAYDVERDVEAWVSREMLGAYNVE